VLWGAINIEILSDADYALQDLPDAQVAQEASLLLTTGNPDVLFLHFDDVDHAGHEYGFSPKVPKYIQAIETVDTHIGTVTQAIKSRSSYSLENWLILVSTDHGGWFKGHGANVPSNRLIFLIVSGPSARKGEITPPPAVVDVPPTILSFFGLEIAPDWGWEGKAVGLSE